MKKEEYATKKDIRELHEEINSLKQQLHAIQNPFKYEVGDVVEVELMEGHQARKYVIVDRDIEVGTWIRNTYALNPWYGEETIEVFNRDPLYNGVSESCIGKVIAKVELNFKEV